MHEADGVLVFDTQIRTAPDSLKIHNQRSYAVPMFGAIETWCARPAPEGAER